VCVVYVDCDHELSLVHMYMYTHRHTHKRQQSSLIATQQEKK